MGEDRNKSRSSSKERRSKKEAERRRTFADAYVLSRGDNFNAEQIPVVKDKLLKLPSNRHSIVQALPLKNPLLAIILSLLAGSLALDRFYLGDIGLGILKVVTFGGFGVWIIVDWFIIMRKAKDINYQKNNDHNLNKG